MLHILSLSNCIYRKDPCTPLPSNWDVSNEIINKVENPNRKEVVIQPTYLPNMKMNHLSTSNNDNWKITKNRNDPNDPNGKLIYKGIKDPNSEK